VAGRRTNLALLVALTAAFATGTLGFAVGTEWGTYVAWLHGVAAMAIVVLTPWKSLIVRRGLRRRRRGKWISVALGVSTVAAVVGGVAHSTGLAPDLGPLTAMQLHVGAALAALGLAVAHVRSRRVRTHRTDLARRQVLKGAALVGSSALAYAGVEALVAVTSLAGSRRRFTGSHEIGSFVPEAMPVTQWLDDEVQTIGDEDFVLRVGDREFPYPRLERFYDRVRTTLDCTGGWYADQDWEGVWLSRLFAEEDAGRSIAVTSVTDYTRHYPMSDASKLLLATRVGGRRLSAGHGGPARIVAPGRRGFWWVKWVTRIDASDRPWWLQPPFSLT
jgi:hypothetical protein